MTGGRLRPAALAAPYPQQAPARGAGQTAFATPADPLRVVLVRDMWLTGFDAPPACHTMYVDKPMRGHGLMQAIARVKPGVRGQAGRPRRRLPGPRPRAEARARGLYRERRHGTDRARPGGGGGRDAGEVRDLLRSLPRLRPGRLDRRHAGGAARALLPAAQEHVLAQENGKDRCLQSGAGAVPGVRAGRAARGKRLAHPRRGGVLPGGALGAGQARRRRGADGGGVASIHAVRQIVLARGGAGGG